MSDYVIHWKTGTEGAWRRARGCNRKSAEATMDIQRQCLTGPLSTLSLYPDGERVWRAYPNEYPYVEP